MVYITIVIIVIGVVALMMLIIGIVIIIIIGIAVIIITMVFTTIVIIVIGVASLSKLNLRLNTTPWRRLLAALNRHRSIRIAKRPNTRLLPQGPYKGSHKEL
jgi:hypothetical protein